jgi:hypothetical protein
MTNILEAICNIVENPITSLRSHYSGRNRMNNMGEALERYTKDAFANTLNVTNELERDSRYIELFSWLGNQNNPPDAMIKGGDAIEIKKTQSANSNLALNSSYPKSTIRSSSTLITPSFRICEGIDPCWQERDIIYVVGNTSDEELKSIWFVYGTIYAADHNVYERIKTTISTGINSIPDVEFAETNELGGVKKVDPLGITNLRIRGMWHIHNPRKVFSYLHTPTRAKFELICLIPKTKFDSFDQISKDKVSRINKEGFSMEEVGVKNPNNPAAQKIPCILIKYIIE